MEDCCAVCAEPLVWLAYGVCGHRDICSTCIVRMRFVLEDICCCICKTECPVVFVTKALGIYTNVLSDFGSLPAASRNGKIGGYWFHSDATAYFDDEDHYKTIKSMCTLGCSICDNASVQNNSGKETKNKDLSFRTVKQLKRHLTSVHRLYMCDLCLEFRKVFISEQKLYTRSQLDRHVHRGDSEVDGNEGGGFKGHPKCDFCQKHFYGENELFMHMSRDHFTCHICQRRDPGRYDYYRNYDDLEAHFSHDHFLCNNPECLEKKFVVFVTEADLKRHNALEHADNMSKSQRQAALQIPVNFQYRRPEDHQSRRGGRGRGPRSTNDRTLNGSHGDIELYRAIQESMETVHSQPASGTRNVVRDQSPPSLSEMPPLSSVASLSDMSSTSSVPPRYLSAVNHGVHNSNLSDSLFPPLPGGSDSSSQNSGNNEQRKGKSLAAVIRGSHTVHVLSRVPRLNIAFRQPSYSASQGATHANIAASISDSSEAFPSLPSHHSLKSETAHTAKHQHRNNLATQSISINKKAFPSLSALNRNKKLNHAASPSIPSSSEGLSAPTAQGKTSNPNEFPALGREQLISSEQPSSSRCSDQAIGSVPTEKEIRAANKALIENIKSTLGGDSNKFSTMKDITSEYRKGGITAAQYYDRVVSMGLSHLVPELARLCPDENKKKELFDVYERQNLNAMSDGLEGLSLSGNSNGKKKKGRSIDTGGDSEAMSSSAKMNNYGSKLKVSEEAEVLSKDGYRREKGKDKLFAVQSGARDEVLLKDDGYRSAKGKQKLSAVQSGHTDLALEQQQTSGQDFLQGFPNSANLYHGEHWSCNACTARNKFDNLHCIVCGTGRSDGLYLKFPATAAGVKEKHKKKTQKKDLLNESSQVADGNSAWSKGGGQRLVSVVSQKKANGQAKS